MMPGIIGGIGGVIIVVIILIIRSKVKEPEWDYMEFHETTEELLDKVEETESVSKAEEYLEKARTEYEYRQIDISSRYDAYYQNDIQRIENSVNQLYREKWEEKADDILFDLSDQYEILSEGLDFSDVDKAFTIRNRILSLYDKYVRSAIDSPIWIDYQAYMAKHISGEISCFMKSRQDLEKKLAEIIQQNRPEYKRKMQIFKDIMDYVSSSEGVYRSDISKVVQSGSNNEIMSCYRDLLKKNRLVEIKLGSRLFVYLSDAEKAKREKTKDEAKK